mmetsp:Transcript_12894/g.27356  ORF Transcript_12894/g.27356 Transcript_12894/m.27356 type:complete len:366 (-) Transcript_12894:579-1676(-)
MLAVPLRTHAAAAWSCVEKMLHEHQRTSAPSACSVSASTAVWMVMWSDPITRTPARGIDGPNSARAAMRPGISCSARSSSFRPKSARDMSATLKSPEASTFLRGAVIASSAAMPGRSFPSSSSSDAPPPVETKVTLSSMLNLAAAVAESPPPMMPLLPAAVVSATASSTALVPLEKVSNSKTPAGPFQMTVLEERIFSRKSFIDSGPQSMPSHPSGMPHSRVASWVGWSFLNSCPHSQSHGKMSSHPFALAFSISLGTSSAPFLSKSELPMLMPYATLRKVYAMPPMHITRSDFSIRFSMTRILSEILAPPTIAVSGRCTLAGSSTCANASSSFATSSPPTHGIFPAMPTIEEWARCAVPKASLT